MITSGVHGSMEEEMARLADSASGTALVGLLAIICNTSSLAYEDALQFVHDLARSEGNESENFVGCTLQYAKDNDGADDHFSDSYMKFFP